MSTEARSIRPKRQAGDSAKRRSDSRRYNNGRWVRLATQIRRAAPLCACDAVRVWDGDRMRTVDFSEPDGPKTRPSRLVDHIRPLSLGGDMWDRCNLQSLCASCHGKKTQRYG